MFKRSLTFFGSLITIIVLSSCQGPVSFDNPLPNDQIQETGIEARALTGPVGTNHPTTAGANFAPVSESTWGTSTWAKGITWVSAPTATYPYQSLRFGVYSSTATKIVLEVYSAATGQQATYDYNMKKGTDNVWRASVKLAKNTLYAFRAWGPNWPFSTSWTRGNSGVGFITDVDAAGNRFNPNKVLYDPYSLEMSHDKETPAMTAAGHDGGMYGSGDGVYKTVVRRNYDTALWAPKSVAVYDTTSFGTKPAIPQKDAIIYEAHVRGLTQHASSSTLTTSLAGITGFSAVANVPASYRGTYLGAGYMAPYLKAMGINTIELLPVHETANDTNPAASPGGNFWGYMTYGYFAPDRRFSYNKAFGGPTSEFKAMVKKFHDNGIEVYLDVVYNHTGEGGNWDATKKTAEITSFRGLDNAAYYALVSTDKGSYWETTGCGNNVNTGSVAGKAMVLDSLTYWTTKMGLDGFRFDLAPVLGRDAAPSYNFNPNASLLTSIASLGTTYNAEMVAEAWDIGTYQVGQFPNGWGEWNGRFRDATRGFFKGQLGTGNGITYADAFYGDYSYFNNQGGPHKSVNFIVAHDGFTLTDLVSYNGKLNTSLAWPFGVSDGGSDSNMSWDSNGDQSLRRQRVRSLLTWQVLARGVPMIVYGDELGRTQNGNNNPYNIDSVATWNNYSMINTNAPNTVATGSTGIGYHNNLGTDANADAKNNIFLYTTNLLNYRKAHVGLRQGDYTMPIYFANAAGGGLNSSSDLAVRIHMDGSSKGDEDLLIYVNNWSGAVGFTAPNADSGKRWVRIMDTAAWAESSNNYWTPATGWTLSGTYTVQPYSIVVFQSTL